MYQLIFIDMARVGMMCYLNWKIKGRNPYKIAYLAGQFEPTTELSCIESGYKIAWTLSRNILEFTVSRQTELFYLDSTSAGTWLGNGWWRCIPWDLGMLSSVYRELFDR